MRYGIETIFLSVLRMFKEYIDNLNGRCDDKPILMPITRRGYWLFRLLYDNREKYELGKIMLQFEIYSDRYLTKLLDNSELKGRHVLLFDDSLITGNNMFYYYTILTKWGAEATPVVYKCLVENRTGIKSDPDCKDLKWYRFVDTCKVLDGNDFDLSGCRKNYIEYIQKFNEALVSIGERYYTTHTDKTMLGIEEMAAFNREICPLVIDLPIIKEKNADGKREVIISVQQWERLIDTENDGWRFVRNISEETPNMEVNGSFFCIPEAIRKRIPQALTENCIIKCKYKYDEADTVRAVFVPFAIMKSIHYEQLIDCFVRLFDGSEYYEYIIQYIQRKYSGISDLREQMLCCIRENLNFYRTLYRAVVLYFSNYLGMEFIHYLSEKIPANKLEYDWEFMKDHIRKELRTTIRKLYEEGLTEIQIKLSELPEYSGVETVPLTCDTGNKESASWSGIYYAVKQMVSDMKLLAEQPRILTIEQMDETLSQKFAFENDEQKRIYLTRCITLFQEGSYFSNFLENNTQMGYVMRGFAPGEGSDFLLGAEAECVVPYIYAYYIKEGREAYSDKYDRFADALRLQFEKNSYFNYKISKHGFEYYINYFRCSGEILKNRLDSSLLFIKDYLEGCNRKYEKEILFVDEWDL